MKIIKTILWYIGAAIMGIVMLIAAGENQRSMPNCDKKEGKPDEQ